MLFSESKPSTSREALKMAMPALHAWLDSQRVQYKSNGQDWRDWAGGLPQFGNPDMHWRVKPADPPQIFWRHLDKERPRDGQACIISDGTELHADVWNYPNGLPDPPESWRMHNASKFVWWSLLTRKDG